MALMYFYGRISMAGHFGVFISFVWQKILFGTPTCLSMAENILVYSCGIYGLRSNHGLGRTLQI